MVFNTNIINITAISLVPLSRILREAHAFHRVLTLSHANSFSDHNDKNNKNVRRYLPYILTGYEISVML
jgi:hypothetical protein